MSKYQQQDNSGSLFKNENKKTDKHPDYSGEALINGQPFFMDAWMKTAESGRRWMSFSFKPKQQRAEPAKQAAPAPRRAPAQNVADMEDDIPW